MANVVVIRLQGGLGNQLFQYAFGLFLSKFENSKIYLDTSLLESHHINDTPRNYELWPYRLSSEILEETERKKLKIINPGVVVKILSASGIKYNNVRYITESNFNNHRRKLNYGDGLIVAQGFWQRLSYLEDVSSHVIEVFYSYDKTNSIVGSLLSAATRSNSVSIHVRRGDYITNVDASKFHQLCDMQYYGNAIKKIEASVPNPVFFVFSDDPDWIEDEFRSFSCEYVLVSSKYSLNHHDELFLMAHCKHNIIANSSYSWWGAWANRNPEKIVIAPTVWHKNSQCPPEDLIPSEWILI